MEHLSHRGDWGHAGSSSLMTTVRDQGETLRTKPNHFFSLMEYAIACGTSPNLGKFAFVSGLNASRPSGSVEPLVHESVSVNIRITAGAYGIPLNQRPVSAWHGVPTGLALFRTSPRMRERAGSQTLNQAHGSSRVPPASIRSVATASKWSADGKSVAMILSREDLTAP